MQRRAMRHEDEVPDTERRRFGLRWRLGMKRGWSRTAVALSSVMLLGSVPLLAQTNFASFTGIVASKDGNPVAGVEVTATNVATGVAYTARSNEAGLYTVSALPIG